MKKCLSERLRNLEEGRHYVGKIFLKVKENRTFIFGAGDRAQWLGKMICEAGFSFEGYLVNRKYYDKNLEANMYGRSKPIFCLEDMKDEIANSIVLLGISQSLINADEIKKWGAKEVIPINVGNRKDYLIDRQTFEEHKDSFDELYDWLEDDYSKECLYACLKGRLTGKDIDFTPSSWSKPEYFFDDVMDWSHKACIVDGGAYIGDTVEEFVNKAVAHHLDDFEIYAWEPDNISCGIMKKNFHDDERIKVVPKAVYSSMGSLFFEMDGGEMSSVNEKILGSKLEEIESDTIDNVLGQKVCTFIKMDVEGSELEALKGAKNQIERNSPTLAICLYHKQEDFWTIPQYIRSIQPKYSFILKTHSSMPTELVLYCFNKEKRNGK